MNFKIEKLVSEWMENSVVDVENKSDYYCRTKDVFEARLYKMKFFLESKKILEKDIPIIIAVIGEIGNNSFDHNIGNWPSVVGIFFGFEIQDDVLKIILSDRGLGVLKTLKRVRPELHNHKDALKVAFTEFVSSRAPERRGNGLKFVKSNIMTSNFLLKFRSGNALTTVNKIFKIEDNQENLDGCLAIIKVNI